MGKDASEKNTDKKETTRKQSKISNLGEKAGVAGFNKNPQNINKKGRPKKIYTILKESGFSADDIRIAFGEVAWYNIKDLKELFEKEDTPVILKVIANAYRNAAKNGKYIFIKEILEQYMGKAMQKSDITSGGEKIGAVDTSNLTDKELIAYNKLLVKMNKGDA